MTQQSTAYGCKQNYDRIGVLISNLGTPEAPTKQALRPYLKQFLSDKRVIELNPVLWWIILNGIVLNTRPKKSAAAYASIWTDEGSPLMATTKKQAAAVRTHIEQEGLDIEVAIGMRYGKPSLESAVDELMAKGCRRILLFPMYPQYAASTTASTYDAVFKHLLTKREVPTLKVVEPYYNRKIYIDALVTRYKEYLATVETPPEKVMLSYHGVPVRYVDNGDPYCCQCVETSQYFAKAAGLQPDQLVHTFQSRFGNEVWLNPYTDKTVEKLAHEGTKRLAVMCPAFIADCLETLEEIGEEAREDFLHNGGERFNLIPCLNDHPSWIQAMMQIIKEETASWRQHDRFQAACLACPVDRTDKGK
jgi:ferrochelatase